jgi:hypothetical protein
MNRLKTATKRTRLVRSFPACSFEEALEIPNAIQRFASGQRIRRLTLFDQLGKSPDSGHSRQLITNSARYGLTIGSHSADYLDLTPDGRIATSPDMLARDRVSARFKLAIENVEPFKKLYEQYRGNKLPAQSVMKDFLLESGLKDEEVSECVETFIVNMKFCGALRVVAGAERLLPVEQVLEETPSTAHPQNGERRLNGDVSSIPAAVLGTVKTPSAGVGDLTKTCFYVTPIGTDDSEERRHADLFLGSIIEPALGEFGLEVIRADKIAKPGMITAQVIDHLLRAKLVVADLSFLNPNVFYELSLRHACRLPTVQIIRADFRIPFDLEQFRTIKIDCTSYYTLVPQLESYKAEIAAQVRRVLEDPEAVDNPITAFCPHLKVTF